MSVSRASRISLAVLLATALVTPAVSAAPSTVADPSADTSRPLGALIAADGTLRTDTGFSGTIDLAGWSLAGGITAGSAPRFTRTPQGTAAGVKGVRPAAAGDWSALGSNGSGDGALNSPVNAIAISGTDIYVGGGFLNAAGIPEADYIAKWNGTAWSALGSNGAGVGALTDQVLAIAISGTDVYAGGSFVNAAGIAEADYLAKWNGSAWSALGDNGAGSGALNALVLGIGITGTDVYVGGGFTDAAGITDADKIAKWNGSAWSAVGTAWGSMPGSAQVYAIGFVGSDVYVVGDFADLGSIPEADNVAKWNGSAWSALGSNGSGDGALNGYTVAIAISGTDVYVGGAFTNAAGIAEADRIAKWDGATWSALGSNGVGVGALTSYVFGLAISGTDLYVGGNFTNAAGIAEADYIAKWDGTAWSALGSNGVGVGALNQYVNTVAISGSDIYAGGQFTNAAGIAEADWIAGYDDGAGASASTLTLSTKDDLVDDAQMVALHAQVTGDGDTPTGKVVFRVGNANGKKLGSCTLNGKGRCTLRTDAIPAGTRRIWARYAGDDGYLPDTAKLPLKVVPAALPAPIAPAPTPEPTPDPGASPAPSQEPAAG